MQWNFLKAVRTISEFDASLFSDLDIGVELQDFTEPTLSDAECYKVLNAYEKKFMHFNGTKALHGSFLDIDIASFNMDIARYSKKLYLRDLFFAKVLGVNFVVFHSNIKVKYASEITWNFFLQSQKDFFAESLDATGFTGIIVLENVLEAGPTKLIALINTISNNRVKINLDIGHALISPRPIKDWIQMLHSHIAYVHLHSNDRVNDTHSPPADNEVCKLRELFDEYNLQVPICLEYWDCDISREIKRLRRCCDQRK